jgi:hypothetical protein
MYRVIDDHCYSIKQNYESAKQTFIKLCKVVQREGFPPNEVWQRVKENLKDIIPQRTLYYWADEQLPIGAKKTTRPKKIATLQSLSDRTVEGILNEDKTEHDFNTEGMGVAILDNNEYLTELEKQNAVLKRENSELKKKLEKYERLPNNDALYNQIATLKKENAQLRQQLGDKETTKSTTDNNTTNSPAKEWLLSK